MYLLHRIGPRISSNWNSLSEILASEGPISFDGIYTEVYDNYQALKGKDVTFFVMGKYVGADNSFDLPSGEMPGRFCTWPQILEMAEFLGAKLGYHGWEHKKCSQMTWDDLHTEIGYPPFFCRNLLAWPHGTCDALAVDVAYRHGYEEAFCAGPYGDGSRFLRRRNYLNWG